MASLQEALRLLRGRYGEPSVIAPSDPFELLLWEYVAYLTDDTDRAAAFQRLKKEVGTRPAQIVAASPRTLEVICRSGGAIAFATRAQRMTTVAQRVIEKFNGTLTPLLRRPYDEARRILKSFPSIGPPGADKILLLTGAHRVLALDSNALRVVLRLGLGQDQRGYAASYASAQAAATPALPRSIGAFQRAFHLLRRHGQEICKRTVPRCFECALNRVCPFSRAAAESLSLSAGRRP